MKKTALLILFLLTALALFALIGGYVGAYLFTNWKSLNSPLSPTLLYRYWHDPKLSPGLLMPLKISIAVQALITALPLIVGLAAALYKPRRELHGSSRFAKTAEIAKLGLLKTQFDPKTDYPDLLLGKHKGKYLRWASNEFAILAARTRSGKGVGYVVPNCLHYSGSLVVYDPKLENYLLTAGYRASVGQKVFLFNPGGKMPEHEQNPNLPLRSHRWNPYTYISRNPLFSYKELGVMAAVMIPKSPHDNGNSNFFTDSARKLFTGLSLYLIETENERDLSDYKQRTTLTNLYKLAAAPPGGQTLTEWIKAQLERELPLSEQCHTLLSDFANGNAKTMNDVLSSMTAPLSIFLDPVVEAATSADDFRLDDLRRYRMTIYIGIVPSEAEVFSRLTNLFFSQLINVTVQQGLPENNLDKQGNSRFPIQCLLLMDEFTALGRVDAVMHGVSYIAGYGLRLLIIIQSPSQLDKVYGKDDAKTFMTNFTTRVFFTPRNIDEAEEYSKAIGQETFDSKSTSRSRGKSGGGSSTSISGQKRAVMNADEIKRMPLSKCVIDMAGSYAIYADKLRYHEDENFGSRAEYSREWARQTKNQPPKLHIHFASRILAETTKVAKQLPEEKKKETEEEMRRIGEDLFEMMSDWGLNPEQGRAFAQGLGLADKPKIRKILSNQH